LGTSQFADWVTCFEAAAERRRADGDPDWARGAELDTDIVRSLQRFQLGESGDGANLAAGASLGGDESYAKAVRLFIAEEQEHARLLGDAEADDVIAALAERCAERDVQIASVDQDYYQLLRDAGPGHGSVRALEHRRPAPRQQAGRKGTAITSAWQQVLIWRDMIRMNDRVPVPAGTITGLATTPLPRPAEVIEKLGLWRRVPSAGQNGVLR
jgi:hypothetical protein